MDKFESVIFTKCSVDKTYIFSCFCYGYYKQQFPNYVLIDTTLCYS